MKITIDGQAYEVESKGGEISVNGKSFAAQAQRVGNLASVTIDGKATMVELQGDAVVVDGKQYAVAAEGLPRMQPAAAPAPVAAPRPAAPRPAAPRPTAPRPAARPQAQQAPAPAARPAAAPAPAASKPAAAPAAAQPAKQSAGGTAVKAPMPGKILRVVAKEGDRVPYGGVLVVLEAMKMENEIRATAEGVVKSINVAVGSTVNAGDTLATIEG